MSNDALLANLTRLNWKYGRGNVMSYTLDGGEGVATRHIPTSQAGGFTDTRRFRLEGNTIHFLGHQCRGTA